MKRRRADSLPCHPRYRVVRRLGGGGSSSVFLSRDLLQDSRAVALKVCHLEIAPEQLLREFRILRELRHPGIARAFDFGRLPGGSSAYFTLEHVAGPDLERLGATLRRQASPASAGPLLDVFLQVADALSYLHGKGLLHRDLKPQNIVFSQGRARLIDFGLFEAAFLAHPRPAKGTAYFTAPEVFDGGPPDPRADLYSLGVTLYRCFTGEYPIPGRSVEEIADNHRHLTPRAPAGIPEGLARVILKLLAKAPRNRFQNAEDAARALGALAPPARLRRPVPVEDLDFAGRKRELDAFFAWFEGIRKGKGPRLFLVEGEAGMGKSRYAEAAVTEMLCAGAQVVPIPSMGQGYEDGMRLLVEKAALLRPSGSALRERCAFLLTSLGIRRDPASARELEKLDLEAIGARVFQETLDLLTGAGAGPLVLVVEDCHRGGARLSDFLRRLAACPPALALSGRLGLLATFRPGAWASELRRGAEPDAFQAIRLGPLARGEILQALRRPGAPLDRRRAARLATASGGNPGLLLELLRRERAEKAGVLREGRGGLPEMLRARFRRLDPESRRLALALALIDRPSGDVLLQEASGLQRRQLPEAKRRLEEEGFLKGSRDLQYLDQDFLEEAVRGFAPEEIQKVHARVGRRLARDPGRLAEAARHLLRGGLAADGLLAAERAGRRLRDAGRVEEAAALFFEALLHAPAHPETRRGLLEELGGLLERMGKFDQAGDCYRRALETGALHGRRRLGLLRKLGGIEQRRGDSRAAREAFDEALRILDGVNDFDEQLRLFHELAALQTFQGDFARAAAYANRGLELLSSPAARRLDRRERADHALRLHSAAGHILLRQLRYDQAAKELERGLGLAEELSSLSDTARILNNLGVAYHQANRLREAQRIYQRATGIAGRMGDTTALFSIRCNVACIRARLGRLREAEAILREAEESAQPRRSRRALLFLLHCRGLVERLQLLDSLELWKRCIRIADELPDPLFAGIARLHLLENEIQQGRWGAARRALADLPLGSEADPRLPRAAALRRAYLDALCGREETGEAILDRARVEPENLDHAGLWNEVHVGAALLELGRLSQAEEVLARARDAFTRSGQLPAALQCSLLLTDLQLRRTDAAAARRGLEAARRLMARVDAKADPRGASAWLPFLEARILLQEGHAGAKVKALIEEAASGLVDKPTAEVAWLLDLVACENGESGAGRRLAASRRRFASGLKPADRRSYLARDHRARLGLGAPGPRAAMSDRNGSAESFYRALVQLRRATDPREALLTVLEAACASRGALFLDVEPGIAAVERLGGRGNRALEELRSAVLRAGAGPVASGHSAELRLPGGKRCGALYVESRDSDGKGGLQAFLDLAGEVLGGSLFPAAEAPTQPRSSGSSAVGATTRTRTLTAQPFIESASPRMKDLLDLVQRTRDSRLPILITGESGAGKDHLARWIHSVGPRRKGPFVAQDCSAIPSGLLEAEMFGYEAGAFTGAAEPKAGCLVAANGGTFYLDNVDSLTCEVQSKLLRVFEEGRVRPLGSRESLKLDVRIVTASQRDLHSLSDRGEFRSDLFFRLSGISIRIPPLRERAEDIPRLLEHFRRQMGKGPDFTKGALEALRSYSWPGNVRELESVVRRLALTAEGTVDRKQVARVLGLAPGSRSFPRWLFEGKSYDDCLEEMKREYLLHLFERSGGDFNRMSRELGTSKRNVYLRFSQAGLHPPELRAPGRE